MTSVNFPVTEKKYHRWAPLALRVIIGFGFMVHGWAKLSKGPAGFEKLLTYLGVPFAHLAAWVTPLVELIGGLAIILGLFVSIAAVPLIFTMLVATFTVQANYGFSSVRTLGMTPQGPLFGPPGYEINLLYIAGLVSLILTGAGIFSLDSLLASRKSRSEIK